MAEITAEGRMSTTTTIIDGKNGSVPTTSMKAGKKSVTEDLVTTFSSPAAWLLVVALIVTWSAVAIVMFDLVDYKAFAGRSVNKLSTEPLRIIHETLEESTDWLYGFISLLSDIVWSDDDDSDEGEVEHSLKRKEIHKEKPERHEKRTSPKVIHRDKPEKREKIETKEPIKVTHKDKLERQEKPEKKERHTVTHKEKPEKPEKHEKKAPSKAIQKEKAERQEKVEKKAPPRVFKIEFQACEKVIGIYDQAAVCTVAVLGARTNAKTEAARFWPGTRTVPCRCTSVGSSQAPVAPKSLAESPE
nr:PREDICTED: triadin [Struthio camelus australis]